MNKVGFVPIREGLRGLSRFILFQPAFTKSHSLRKSGKHALLYHKLSYVVCIISMFMRCLLITRQRRIKKYGKYKYVTLFTKLYTSPPCLTMSITCVKLLFINYFNGRYYISAYTVLIVYNTFHTGIKHCCIYRCNYI